MRKTKEIKNNYLTETDSILLKDLWPIIEQNKQVMIRSFYSYLEKFDELREVLDKYERTQLELAFATWLFELFHGEYDNSYAEKRKTLGDKHRMAQIPMTSILATLGYIRGSLNYYIHKEIGEKEPAKAAKLSQAVNKALDLDLLLISKGYAQFYTIENKLQS